VSSNDKTGLWYGTRGYIPTNPHRAKSGDEVSAPRDYYEPDEERAKEDTLTERDRKLKVRRLDKVVGGRIGFGVSYSPYSPLGLGAYVKWWPCTGGLAFQISICPIQIYVCWFFKLKGDTEHEQDERAIARRCRRT